MLNIKTKSEVVLRQAIGAMRSREVVSLLSLVHSFLDSADSGSFLSLQGQRRIGKTSLLRYLFEDEKKSRNFDSVIFVRAEDFEDDNFLSARIPLRSSRQLSPSQKVLALRDNLVSNRILLIFDDIDLVHSEKLESFIRELRASMDFARSDSKIIFSYSQYLPEWKPSLLSHSNLLSLAIDENTKQVELPKASLEYDPRKTKYGDVISVLTELDSIYFSLTGDNLAINKVSSFPESRDGVLENGL